jgi:hypothetical protein
MTDPHFPILQLGKAQEHLRRPFAPRALKWKIQTSWPKEGVKKGGLLVAYIDARLVIERLDTVVGPLWSDEYELIPGTKAIICRLTIDGVTRSDVGESNHSTKGTVSDALKRAAVHFGIGLPIYAMSQVRLHATANGATHMGADSSVASLKQTKRGNKNDVEISPDCQEWLRAQYERWLASPKNRYGDALDHGGDDDAVGMDPEDNGAGEEPVQTDLELEAAIHAIRALWEEKGDKRKLSKAKLNANLKAVSTVEEATEYARSIPLKENA